VHPLRVYLMASLTFFLVIKSLEHFGPPNKGEPPIVFDHGSKKAHASHSPSPGLMVSPSPGSIASSPAAAKISPSPDEEGGLSFKIGEDQPKSKFEKWLKGRIEEKIGPGGSRGDLFLKALIDNLPYMVLCSIPLFALVLKILYLWKKRYYIEHLVFALHTHAF